MTTIYIPPAALEAGAMHIYQNWHRNSADLLPPWEFLAVEYRQRWIEQARAAFVAMVTAWEGMHTHEWQRPWLGGMSGTDLILPLAQKQEDGDA